MNKSVLWILSGLLSAVLILFSGFVALNGAGPYVFVALHLIPYALGYGGSGDYLIWMYYIVLWGLITLLFKWIIGLLTQKYRSRKPD